MISQFEIIPVIAETRSFSKAAKLLHLSQPAISSKVQAMEDYYGVKFFHRTTHGVTLTEAGNIFVEYADKFIALHQDMHNELHQLTHLTPPNLTIGASCTAGNFAMPSSLRAFKLKYPETNIKLNISNSKETINKVLNRELDLAVVEGAVITPGLTVFHLDSIPLVLVFPTNDNMRIRKKISLQELKSKPFVTREKGAAVYDVINDTFAKAGYNLEEFNLVSEMNSIHSVKAAIESGMGISIVPKIAVENELANGSLTIVKIKEIDNLSVDINLIYRDDEEPSMMAEKFISFLTHPKRSGFSWNK